jgi:hypothetical protein
MTLNHRAESTTIGVSKILTISGGEYPINAPGLYVDTPLDEPAFAHAGNPCIPSGILLVAHVVGGESAVPKLVDDPLMPRPQSSIVAVVVVVAPVFIELIETELQYIWYPVGV